MKKLKKLPKFKSEAAERKFWSEHDSTEYLNWGAAEMASFPNLKPTTKTISLRLPLSLLNRIKSKAHQSDVPYQSLIKIMLNRSFQEKEAAKG